MNYSVKVVENVNRRYCVSVDAKDEEEAVQIVTEQWKNGEISDEDIEDSEIFSDESELVDVYPW